MYSTATDMATFLAQHCHGAKNPLLSQATLEEMMTGSAPSPQYGLGYQVYPAVNGVPIAGNSGSNLGWKTNFVILPSKGLGIAILTNAQEGKTRMDIFRAFRELVLQRYGPPKDEG
jgi:CubicO group peptidase (beta-lactamase class C family)